MLAHATMQDELDEASREFYCQALTTLLEANAPFMVGGAFAFGHYSGVSRHTKDLDIFVKPEDCQLVMDILARAGYKTELPFPHWLGKAYCGDNFIDIIFNSGNGVAVVDDEWFAKALTIELLGLPVKICPAEEVLWSKMYIMERERYDGADVAHLLRGWGNKLDWPRLLRRVGEHWPVLLSHLTLFTFIYPAHRNQLPVWVMEELLDRMHNELKTLPPDTALCQGTLLSRQQYLPDVERWQYEDARLEPEGNMTAEQIEIWTEAISEPQ